MKWVNLAGTPIPVSIMTRFSLPFIAAIAILCAPATQAADFDLQTTPSRAAADFTGVGLGIDLGAGLGSGNGANASGRIGGAHVGYNFQASRLVGGAEADVTASGIKSSSLTPPSFKQNYLTSARVKAGWAFADLLAYGTLGWGYSTSKLTDASGESSKTIKGAAYGAGAEFAVTRNFFLRAEYLRFDFGKQSYSTPLTNTAISTSTNLLRAGASVHF